MQKQNTMFLFLLCSICVLISCKSTSQEMSEPNNKFTYSIVEEYYSVDLSSIELDDDQIAVSVGANIPQVKMDNLIGEKVNSHIQAAVDEFLRPLASQIIPPDFGEPDQWLNYQLSHEVGTSNQTLLSILFYGHDTTRTTGVNRVFYSLNIDMRTGNLVRLNDIYSINNDFGNAVASNKEIYTEYGTDDFSELDYALKYEPNISGEKFAEFISSILSNLDNKIDATGNFRYIHKNFSYIDSQYLYVCLNTGRNSMERVPLDVLKPYLNENYTLTVNAAERKVDERRTRYTACICAG